MTDEEKAKVWKELQEKDPVMADILKRHTKVFGKPTEVRITFKTKQEAVK